MNKKFTKILVHLLFLQTLFFQVDLPELVLCFGEDGHVAIEKAIDNACEHDGDTALQNIVKIKTIKPLHDDCTDIKLDWHFANADIVKKTTKLLKNHSPGFVTVFFSQSLQHTNQSSYHISKTSKHTLSAIQTTVLLI